MYLSKYFAYLGLALGAGLFSSLQAQQELPLEAYLSKDMPLWYHCPAEALPAQHWAASWAAGDTAWLGALKVQLSRRLPFKNQESLEQRLVHPDSLGIAAQGNLYLGLDFDQEDIFILLAFDLSSYKVFQSSVQAFLNNKYLLRRPWLSLAESDYGLLLHRQKAILVLPRWAHKGYALEKAEQQRRIGVYLNKLARIPGAQSLAEDKAWQDMKTQRKGQELLRLSPLAWDSRRLAGDSSVLANFVRGLAEAQVWLIAPPQLAEMPTQLYWFPGAWPLGQPTKRPAAWAQIPAKGSLALAQGFLDLAELQTLLKTHLQPELELGLSGQTAYLWRRFRQAEGQGTGLELRLSASPVQLQQVQAFLALASLSGTWQAKGQGLYAQTQGIFWLSCRQDEIVLCNDSSYIRNLGRKYPSKQRLGKKQGYSPTEGHQIWLDFQALAQAEGAWPWAALAQLYPQVLFNEASKLDGRLRFEAQKGLNKKAPAKSQWLELFLKGF